MYEIPQPNIELNRNPTILVAIRPSSPGAPLIASMILSSTQIKYGI